MKILLAGEWRFSYYEPACAHALEKLGVTVQRMSWANSFSSFLGKAQAKWTLPGPAMLKINCHLLAKASYCKPDVVFVWRGTHVLPSTLRAIRRRTGAILVSYNNDDPLGPRWRESAHLHHRRLWRYYLKSVPEYDLHFVYRPINLVEIKAAGAREAHVLMPYFIPSLHHPVALTESEKVKYGCDVVFIGHYEPDGREEYLKAMVEAGVHVKLFGGKYWTRQVLGPAADYFGQVHEVFQAEYTKALCGAKMCLCFLSRLNRDVYTRRCFEIPACGRMLLSERTPELQRLFREDEEAVYFSSPPELVEKVSSLLGHPERIEEIAQAGNRRVIENGHSIDARMKWLVELFSQRM